MSNIDKNSHIPVYYQLKEIILTKINNREFEKGDLIPSERALSEEYGISRMTARHALNQLVDENIIYREKGKGTFVSNNRLEQRNIMSFSDTVRSMGMEPSTWILKFERETPDNEVIEALNINKDTIIYKIRRLRLANSVPIAIEEVYIPENKVPNLEQADLTKSLYKLMKSNYSYKINYIDTKIEAKRPTQEVADLLKITKNTPVLNLSSVTFTDMGLRLFYEKSVYCSDKYIYNIRINLNK